MKTLQIPPILEGLKGGLDRYKYVLVVIGVGVLFLLTPSSQKEVKEEESSRVSFEISIFEEHLAEVLSLIQGAGNTNVVLTLKNDGETVYAQNIQREAEGKNTATTVTVGSGSGEQVVEVQQLYPQFQGALIVCAGGDNPAVQLELIRAVSALTGLGSDSISVCKSIDS